MLVAGAVAGPANAATDVPSDIAVPAGNKLFFSAHAVGVQTYTCNSTPTGYSWSSATARADLFDKTGKVVMTHIQGPTWQARDGSTVVGQREAGVTVDPTAIQ